MKNKSFTLADRRSSRLNTLGFCKAFTLAEILISLTIIGIIAALTLPALMANLNEKVWNTKRKALHSRMAQALAAMPNLDRYLETDDNSAAFNFINDGLATTLNITKVCDEDNMSKCDFNWPERSLNDDVGAGGSDIVSFNTINGESIGVQYEPECTGESNADFLSSDFVPYMECANFIYDLNGASKGPNKFGKDMGLITAYFPEYPLVVAPMPVGVTKDTVNASDVEDLLASNPDFRLPNYAEASTLSYNSYFISDNYPENMPVWSDNNVICNGTCERADDGAKAGLSSAHLILLSKNGDAAKTFKTLENEKQIACDPAGNISQRCILGKVWGCNKATGQWECIPE